MKAENTALRADTRVNHADVLAEDGDGRVFQTTAPYGTIYNFFDPYGLVFFNERTYPGSAKRKPMEWVEYDDFGDVIERDLFTAADCTYADSTTIDYSYTPDGLPERTTWARGAWKELQYD